MMSKKIKTLAKNLSYVLVLFGMPGLVHAVVVHNVDYLVEVEYQQDKDLLDVYMPEGAHNVPVMVFFHGGGLRMGKKEDARVFASRFVPKGIGVVLPNYRLSPSVMHPAHIQDAAAAIAWVIKNIEKYGGDPDRIYVAGHSAGAYLAVLLTLDAKHLQAHGLNLHSIRGTIPISPFLYVEETAAVRPKDVWGTDPANWLAASVTPHINKGKRPMLLIYADGDADWRKRQNETFVNNMRTMGNDARAVEVVHRDHMTLMSDMNSESDQIGELVLKFIDDHP